MTNSLAYFPLERKELSSHNLNYSFQYPFLINSPLKLNKLIVDDNNEFS